MKPFLNITSKLVAGFFTCLIIIVNFNAELRAQLPTFTVNLTGNPAGSWSSPNISRNDHCCSAGGSYQCVLFNLTLDPNAAGIQIDMVGADPYGSLFYDIGCAGNYPGGSIKCISGIGPHIITFCKPGHNKNIYKITSISKPTFPKDDTVRIGCKLKLKTLGIVNSSVTWQSIFPGTLGQYNSYLDSIHVASPTYSPSAGAPLYVDYKVCGFPLASGCGFSITVCDTVRIYNYPALTTTVTPNPATFCNIGPGSGVTLNGLVGGGLPAYSYIWKNSIGSIVGTGVSYFSSIAGTYNLIVKDKLYDPSNCPAAYTSVSVGQGTVPIVDAGPSKKVCASNPSAILTGSVQYASGGVWSGGLGSYVPSNTSLNTSYTPSAGELSAGFVKLYLTSSGAGGSCINKKDSTIIYYSQPLGVSISSASLACNNSTTTISALVIGGTSPYSYNWSTGSTNNSINVGQGNYSVLVTDSVGCTGSSNLNLVAPTALNISFNVTNVSVNGGNDGIAIVNVSGGTPAYTVTWTPTGLNTFTINSLFYGAYTAVIKDANGCLISGSTVVNEPRCLALTSIATSTNVLCNGASNGVATVTVSGGNPVYTYTWNTSPPQNTQTAINLNAGVYSVLVKDFNNCYQTANITITEPTLLINVMTHTNVTVIGGNNGSAAANPFGGTIPYSYLWNTAAITSSITGLFAGTYTVNITDNNGCVKADNVKINEPPCNNLTLNVLSNNVVCYGGSNGSAIAIVGGFPVGTYTISWSNGLFGPSISSLSAGSYSAVVTNSLGCSEFVNFSITEPSQLSVGLLPTNISCKDSIDGSIDLTISGGSYPYTFSWSSGSTSEDLVSVKTGTYSVLVKDANGCTAFATTSISEPTPLSVISSTQNVTCIYGTNGAIALTVSGGTFPYFYNWSTGATTQSVSSLSAGGYTVSVKDANNCTIASPLYIAVHQPDSVLADSIITSCSIPGSGQTQVRIVPSGGYSGIYQVSFNGGAFQSPGVYTAMLNNSTTYSIVIKDGNNCSSLIADTITIKGEVKIDSVVYGKCYSIGTSSVPVTVYSSGGDNGPYSVSFNNGVSYLTAGTYSSNVGIASSYTVFVKDGRGCISALKIISLPSIFSSTLTSSNVLCNGGNGSATLTASGGTTAYSYLWSNGAVTNTISAIAGVYTGTVTDANLCTSVKTVTITQPAILTSTVVGTNVLCNGGNGSATLTASGGTTAYSYLWSNGAVTNTISAIAGVYTGTVTDANLCTSVKTVTITEPAVLTSTVSGTNVLCNGGNGSATLTASGGTIAYSYLWSNGAVTNTISAIAGVYTGTVTDANLCTSVKTVTITEPAVLTSTVSGTNVLCNGGNGSATLTASGGTIAYSYLWSNGAVTNTISAIAGVYTGTVTDANLCTSVKTVTITEPAVLTSTVSGTNVLCNGGNGSATLTASGGTTAYSYLWSNGAVTNTMSAIAGVYTGTVTDANLCTSVKTVTITQPAVLTSTVVGTNVLCNGGNGSATLTASGGTTAYSYLWSNGAVTNTISAIAGVYTGTVTDANLCTSVKTVTITQPAVLTSTVVGTNVLCNGGNGSATLTASGGTTAYSYLWSNGAVTNTISAIAGVYTGTVTDANLCTSVKTVTITEPAVLTSTVSGTNVLCNGGNGSATLTASGGTIVYSYLWSNGAVTNTILAIAGVYTGTVTDANLCTSVKTVTITQPAVLTSTVVGTNVLCNGGNGSATLTASGGTIAYSYLWSNGAVTNTISAIAGVYTGTVTDANLCISVKTVTITEPAVLTSTVAGTNVLCNGGNGSATITASGGTIAYSYLWSNGAVTNTISAIAGVYTGTVTDANLCTSVKTVTITQSAVLTSTVVGTNVLCNGGNGSATLTASGGTTAYSYLWSNGAVTNTISAIAGVYTGTVTDANLCTSVKTVTITEPSVLTSTVLGTNVLCNGGNGSATLTASGGTTAYSYLWSNGAVTNTISAIAGVYTGTVTDANLCTSVKTVTITQPAVLTSTVVGTNVLCNGGNGSATLTASGGTTAYSYLWSNGAVTNTISAIAGVYTGTVTDANLCTSVNTVTITQPAILTSTVVGTNVLCNGGNGSATLTVSGGTSAYSYLWSNGAVTSTMSAIAGVYTGTVTDANGCLTTQSITITEPAVLTSTVSGTNVLCNGGNGSATLTASGGTTAYSYLWSNGAVTSTISAIAGVYTGTVTDSNGCLTSQSITITEPSVLTSTLVGTNVLCNGGKGSAILIASGGTTAYSYLWSNGAVTNTISAIAGVYTGTVTDANLCMSVKTVTITQPTALTSTSTVTSPLCHGVSTGSVNVTISGGVVPYSYSWSNGATTQNLNSIAAGSYTLHYNDQNGCKDSMSVTLNQPDTIKLVKKIDNLKCNGDTIGNVFLTPSGGTGPYTYLWSDGSTGKDLSNINSGVYSVILTDANGCVFKDTSKITQPDSLKLNLYSPVLFNGYNVSTYNGNDGSINLTITGGLSPYTYLWSNGSATQNLYNLTAGNYFVTVMDTNGCRISGSILLREPFVLEMPQGYSPNDDGKNDLFVVHGIEAYPDNVLTIYNRWGNIVYRKSGYLNEWDGKNNSGELLPDATYFAILEINKGEIVLKGYVELRR